MEEISIKEIYGKLKVKLPEFDKLDYEFEINACEAEGFILRNIRRKICDKYDFGQKFLEEMMQTECLFALVEAKEFNEEDIEKAFVVYKKIMYILRLNVELDIEDTDQKNADFIIMALNEWQTIKKELLAYNARKIKCWKNPATKPEKLGYLG